MKSTAAVIVTYNRCAMLEQCIRALLRQTAACDILIVDNCSTDHTASFVATLNDPAIRYRRLEKNSGGAGGFNAGMRWAVEEGYSFVWLMDDDCLPEPEALAELLAADQILKGDHGFLCSSVLWTDGKECRMNRQKIRKDYYTHQELLCHGMIRVEQATFVSLFLRREIILKAGLPLKEFFIWGDDIEYTRRLAVRMALPCFLAGRSKVVHAMAQNTGSDLSTDTADRLARYRFAYRNENYLYRREGFSGWFYYNCRCMYHFWKVVFKAKSHRLKRLWTLCSASFRGYFFNPAVEYVNLETMQERTNA